jgi:hypothetical protein
MTESVLATFGHLIQERRILSAANSLKFFSICTQPMPLLNSAVTGKIRG